MVQLLIQAGADLNAVDTHQQTALMIAASEGHWRVINALIRAGADSSSIDNEVYLGKGNDS